MEQLVQRALFRAEHVKEGETGFVTAEKDGMVAKIWYHTTGYHNELDKYDVVTVEEWEWEKAGCTNNEEWHAYLNKQMWKDYSAGLNTN